MFTANDAHMRDFRLVVPADCVASEDEAANTWALRQMRRVMRADTRPSDRVPLRASNGRRASGAPEQDEDQDNE